MASSQHSLKFSFPSRKWLRVKDNTQIPEEDTHPG